MSDYVEYFLPEFKSSKHPAISPMPVIRDLELSWCDRSESFQLPLVKVDCGADYSALPKEWALMASMHGVRLRTVEIELPDGDLSTFYYFMMRYKIPRVMKDWGVAGFLVMNEYLIGRNILKNFVVTLNGPDELLTISNPTP